MGFRVLVLCAAEYPPPAERFPGLQVIHAPNDDSYERLPTREELALALGAARRVAETGGGGGHRVLVTCGQGRNRSGLVSALALHLRTGCSGADAVRRVQRRRQRRSIGNPGFVACLHKLGAR